MTLVLTTETNPGTAQWTNASLIGTLSSFKYPVICLDQLVSDGSVRQAGVIVFTNSPKFGDKIIFKSTTGTETYTAVASGQAPGNFLFNVPGPDLGPQPGPKTAADLALKNLTEAISSARALSGGKYSACQLYTRLLGQYDAGVVVYRYVQAEENYEDRIYSNVVNPTSKTFDFSASSNSYAYYEQTVIPNFDPGQTFGPGTAAAADGEIHLVIPESDASDVTLEYAAQIWSQIDAAWQLYITPSPLLIDDPGNTNTIQRYRNFQVVLDLVAPGETRVLANPGFLGQTCVIQVSAAALATCVVTAALGLNSTGGSTITFNATAQSASLVAVPLGNTASLRWQVVSLDGATVP